MGEVQSVLVTGAGGFLGAWAIKRLLQEGMRVHAFDLSQDTSRIADLCDRDDIASIDWIAGDLTDPDALRAAVARSECESILHLAALTIPACRQNPVRGAEVDIIGHINVLEAARAFGLRQVVYTSSIAAHPRGQLNAPANLYGVYKSACEGISKVYWQDHGLASIGLRPNIVYGIGRDVGETAAITQAMRAAALGQPYRLPFSGRACLQYAGDVAEIFLRCLRAPAWRPFVSDIATEITCLNEVVATIRRIVPSAKIDIAEEERPAPDIPFSTEELTSLIGEWRHTPIEEGIRLTIEAYRRTRGAEVVREAGNAAL